MSPPAVVEEQAKLGVSAEESKAQRLKRQQARFRDRGGAFVPSEKNLLVDILLARNVSGESPSKTRPKDVTTKRLSPSKAGQSSPTRKAGVTMRQAVTGSPGKIHTGNTNSKPLASKKRKVKSGELPTNIIPKHPPKRRGRPPKTRKKTPDADPDAEQSPPKNMPTSTLKAKGKQRTTPSTSDGKLKPKPKSKAKSNPIKAAVIELASDDDKTLVEVPHKARSNSKRKVPSEGDGETDDDAPTVRRRVILLTEASGAKPTTSEKTAGKGGPRKNMQRTETVQNAMRPKTDAKKRVADDDDERDLTAPVTEKVKAAISTSTFVKPLNDSQPTVTSRTIKDVRNSRAMDHGKGKGRNEPVEDDERHPECSSKPKKRKKEEDNYDDRARKLVRFCDTGPPHSSSKKLKENQSDGKYKNVVKSENELDDVKKPPSRTNRLKGPPLEVLERIKASAARHLQCADSEPDELDCFS